MKKVFLITLILSLGVSVGNEIFAQESAKNRVGFFLAAASGDIDEIGIAGVGEFKVHEKVAISPQLIFYFPEDRGGVDVSFLEVNVNANYYFYNQDIFEFYGLGGLNYSRVKINYDNNGNDYSDGEMGLNLGAGINFELGKNIVPFSELRVTVGDFDQFVISGGLKFNLR
jgi:outer membrane protein X